MASEHEAELQTTLAALRQQAASAAPGWPAQEAQQRVAAAERALQLWQRATPAQQQQFTKQQQQHRADLAYEEDQDAGRQANYELKQMGINPNEHDRDTAGDQFLEFLGNIGDKVLPQFVPGWSQVASPIAHAIIAGGGVAPPPSTDLAAAQAAYKTEARPVRGFRCVRSTPTLKLFHKTDHPKSTCLLAVRGTADRADIAADIALPLNGLTRSDRYRRDLLSVQAWARVYSWRTCDWYITGHSLGSAIALALMREFSWIRQGLSFNGALQTRDVWNQSARMHEVYQPADPLFRTMGRAWKNKTVMPPSSAGSSLLTAHGIASFQPALVDQLVAGAPGAAAPSLTPRARDVSSTGMYDGVD